jgi:hypothetical protein
LAFSLVALSAPLHAQTTSLSNSNSASNSGSAAIITNNAPSVVRSTGRLETTANAFAPGLTSAGINSCAGSASIGGAGTGFSFGAGSTFEMEECTRRANAAALAGLGYNAAALEMLCESPSMRRAINLSGATCPSQRAEYEALQARANATGEMVVGNDLVPPAPPAARRQAVRRQRRADTRIAVEAAASNSR